MGFWTSGKLGEAHPDASPEVNRRCRDLQKRIDKWEAQEPPLPKEDGSESNAEAARMNQKWSNWYASKPMIGR